MLFLLSLTVQNHNSGIGVSLVTPDLTAALCPTNNLAPVSALVTLCVSPAVLNPDCRELLCRNRFSVMLTDVLTELTPCFESHNNYFNSLFSLSNSLTFNRATHIVSVVNLNYCIIQLINHKFVLYNMGVLTTWISTSVSSKSSSWINQTK